ncbi:selenium metabolism-associated LysR family transcriptional regulator [Desulfomicrobium sp. ZS1]|jgi:DNA-binding transcriptional LysR family regulator|uniref:selenium metabolism-associated LysR family transcriptional regulator n=1 Tax=Desulfomicrobium sp. ZS1 TaxID=2952228 RepID=UPI0020B2B564|nr:selenium metabolism-associated LysR family transcriptional regulator [Desulfomicrobium sp. ZS1]UTF49599.1 selenium metabolism-associated LysR family transcriptional regulator [Desulfomicrobium sp. ZS1]
MDIRKIEAFSKVYEHSSFSKAGKSLYLSQPTISAHVASLEQELEVQLFDRIGRTVVPTKAGEVLYGHAKKIFEASELAISELRKLQDRITGKLDLGGSTIPANYIMPEILAQFWKKYPEVIMDLHIGDSEDIVTQVRNNELMLGVVGAVFESPDLHYEKIASDSLVLVMTPQLFEKYRHLAVEDLLHALPWVLREDGSGTRVAMAESLSRFDIDIHSLRTVIMVRNAGAMARCLSAGMGASITSAITVHHELETGALVAVDLPGLLLERSFHIVFNKKRSLFPAALKLLEFFKNNAQNIAARSGS